MSTMSPKSITGVLFQVFTLSRWGGSWLERLLVSDSESLSGTLSLYVFSLSETAFNSGVLSALLIHQKLRGPSSIYFLQHIFRDNLLHCVVFRLSDRHHICQNIFGLQRRFANCSLKLKCVLSMLKIISTCQRGTKTVESLLEIC